MKYYTRPGCGSQQFNLHQVLINQKDLCDVHSWQRRASRYETELHEIANYPFSLLEDNTAAQEMRRIARKVLSENL